MKNYISICLLLFSSSLFLALALRGVSEYATLIGVSIGTVFLILAVITVGVRNRRQT